MTEGAGAIGLPLPGIALKFIPSGANYELRVRGPHVTPGYFANPAETAAAFDGDDFYKIGDAGKWADLDDLDARGAFDGRIAEDFSRLPAPVNAGKIRCGAAHSTPPRRSKTWSSPAMTAMRSAFCSSPARPPCRTGRRRAETKSCTFPT